jgi:SAM-dependent methyltransferase
LTAHRRDWEELARLDPYWAILSAPGLQHGGWQLDEFLATGRADVQRLMARAHELGVPERHERALDFGCGVGRHTRLLAEHFEEVVGVDVSAEMVRLARRINEGVTGVSFVVNADERLAGLLDESFDLVQSQLVLQHLPDEEAILGYIGEMLRVLRPGGLLFFQVPVGQGPRRRLQGRRHLYAALRRVGVPAAVLYSRLGLTPVRMTSAAAGAVERRLAAGGGRVIAHEPAPVGKGYRSTAYWVAKS